MPVPQTQITGVTGLYKGRTAPLIHSHLKIGRTKANGLSFPLDLTLSREHAQIVFRENGWVVEDLDSINGTYVNGWRISSGGSMALRPGDVVKCGFQSFRLDWELFAPSEPLPTPTISSAEPQRKVSPPTNPVLLGKSSTVILPPVHRVPTPPPTLRPAPKKSKAHGWVSPGEIVEVHRRRISCGMFFFGTGMKDASGYGIEPSLIDPALAVTTAENAEDSDTGPDYAWSYTQLGLTGRAHYLDWLAQGRPAESTTDSHGFLFLSGIERRHLSRSAVLKEGLNETVGELRRLIAGAPEGLRVVAHMRKFLVAVGADALQSVTQPLTLASIGQIHNGSQGESIGHLLARRIAEGAALNSVEALMATAVDESTYPRTPFYRCTPEVHEFFRLRYEKKYPQGITPKVTSETFDFSYRPVNPHLYGYGQSNASIGGYRIAPSTMGKLREFLTEATDALDSYSRRLAGRVHEAGKLPSIALLPSEVALSQPDIRRLAEIAGEAVARGGKLDLGLIAEMWIDWPSDRALNKGERELLARALWHAGFVSEPHWTTPGSLGPTGVVCIALRTAASRLELSATYTTAVTLVSLAALVVLADGRLSDEEIRSAKSRLGSLANNDEGEALRLGLYLEWLIETGVPKIGKKAFDSVTQDLRTPLLRFLSEIAAADGQVAPAEVKEIVRIAKALGIPEEEVFPILHSVHADPASKKRTASESSGHGLDMELVAKKLASSRAATEMLGTVFKDDVESEPPCPTPVFAESIEIGAPSEDPIKLLVQELLNRCEWSASEFSTLAERHGKMPAAVYDDLNEVALDAVGDPLLEGDDPIFVDPLVAQELLK